MYCKNCGTENNNEARFCKTCGNSLESQENNNLQQDNVYGNYNQGGYSQGGYNQGNYVQGDYNRMNANAFQGNINNNLVFAILTTIFCCIPLGIVSIVYAAQVDSFVRKGFYQEARDSADKAKKWAIASLVTGIIVNVLFGILIMISIAAEL